MQQANVAVYFSSVIESHEGDFAYRDTVHKSSLCFSSLSLSHHPLP